MKTYSKALEFGAQFNTRFNNHLGIIIVLIFSFFISKGFSQTITATGNGTWTCPTGVTSVSIECWGAGGGGGGGGSGAGCGTAGYGSGAAGGSYTIKILTVVPGTTYKYTVGSGGAGGVTGAVGSNGGGSYFGNSVAGNSSDATVLAVGGSGGNGNIAGSGTALGNTTGNIGTTSYKGGNGASFSGTNSGAGGSGAGTSAVGGSATGTTAGTSASGGGTGGGGLIGNGVGTAGTQPGGGGSGGRNSNATCRTGGAGGNGKIVILSITAACSSPTTQATTFTYSNIAEKTMTLGWTRGNGDNVMVVAKEGSTPTDPTSGTTYTANAAYGSGTACGGGFVVYSGIGTSVALTSLLGNKTYYFAAYEYSTAGTCYNMTELTGSSTTLDQETWVGGTSVAWATAANWSSAYVPLATTNVTIPSGTTFAPTISTSTLAPCKNLTINSGATLTNAASNSNKYLDIYGDLINNGTINHSGSQVVYMNTTSSTIGGSGTFTTFAVCIFGSISVSLTNDISIQQLNINSGSTLNLSTYSLIVTDFLDQTGALSLGSGTMEFRGASAGHTFVDAKLAEGTGTFYYNGVANSQTIQTGTYYNLKIATVSGNTATIGSSAATTVSNDLTILNPSTAGGIASVLYDVNVTGNTYVGNTGNALTLNMSNRIIGTGTFTMGNVAAHAINIIYTSSSNFAITCFGTPIFYGTVTYTSATAQKVITANSYNNLIVDLAGTKTLFGALDVNGNLSLTGGTFDVSTFNVNLAGDFVKQTAATLTANTATFTLDGSSAQYVNVTAVAGTTACNADITFYNLVVNGSDVKIYYNKTNNRKYNTNDFTVNSGKQVSFISQ